MASLRLVRSADSLSEIARAIEAREFELHYQPIVAVDDRRVVGAEALARWRHPSRGVLGAEHFIGAIEGSALIVALGSLLLVDALAQARVWSDSSAHAFHLNVNVSARQFERLGFADLVLTLLDAAQVDPSRLCLELTETAALHNIDSIHGNVLELRRAGIGVAIDDFGAGYTSLALLRDLEVSVLKLDRSFVSRIEDHEHDRRLISSLLAMAKGLEATVIAEGVETESQAAILSGLGCPLAQGYLYGMPAEPRVFERAYFDATGALPPLEKIGTTGKGDER